MSGNGIRCLAWVAARAGLGDGDALVVDTGGGRRAVDLERDADGDGRRRRRRHGPGHVRARRRSRSTRRSPFDLEADVPRRRRTDGDAAGMGNPHLVLFVDDPADARASRSTARASSTTRASRAAPTSSSSRVDRRRPSSRCGSGSAASGRRCRAAPARAPSAAVAHRRGLVGDARHRARARRRPRRRARRHRPARRPGRARVRRRRRRRARSSRASGR